MPRIQASGHPHLVGRERHSRQIPDKHACDLNEAVPRPQGPRSGVPGSEQTAAGTGKQTHVQVMEKAFKMHKAGQQHGGPG